MRLFVTIVRMFPLLRSVVLSQDSRFGSTLLIMESSNAILGTLEMDIRRSVCWLFLTFSVTMTFIIYSNRWLRKLYWNIPAFKDTCNFDHIKVGYYAHRQVRVHKQPFPLPCTNSPFPGYR